MLGTSAKRSWIALHFFHAILCQLKYTPTSYQGALLKAVEKLGPFGISAGSQNTNLRARWMRATGGALLCVGMISLTGI